LVIVSATSALFATLFLGLFHLDPVALKVFPVLFFDGSLSFLTLFILDEREPFKNGDPSDLPMLLKHFLEAFLVGTRRYAADKDPGSLAIRVASVGRP